MCQKIPHLKLDVFQGGGKIFSMKEALPVNLVGFFCEWEDRLTVLPKDFSGLFLPKMQEILKEVEGGKKIVSIGSCNWEVFDFSSEVGEGGIHRLLIFVPLNREMTHIYSMIIHELKNPIAAIRAMVQVMETGIKEGVQEREKLLQYTSLILEEIDRMNRILSSIMKLAKPKTRFRFKFDLVEETKKAMATWGQEFKSQGIKMTLITNREKIYFLGNPDEIHQIINNLLRNSKEALEGVKEPRVIVDITETRGEIIMRVKDNGRGMEPEVMEKIKTSFYSSKPQGLGLGLFVVKSIVGMYGGELNIKSEEGKGCEITLRFPRR